MYYLLDKELNLISPIESYKSAIWTKRYYAQGDFELYIPATSDVLNLIKRDYYVVRDDDFTKAMIVKDIQIDTDVEDGNYIIVTGKCLKNIIGQRIVWNQTTVDGTVEECIRKLLNENIINPTIAERKIDNFILGDELGDTPTMQAQYTGDNLDTVISALCTTHNLGYDVSVDLDTKQFIFTLYRGMDRSYNQTENPYVVFSNEFENLLTSTYKNSAEKYKNVALVAGEGEGVERKTTVVGSASGLERHEIFVDAKSISTKSDDEITDDEYISLLNEKGNETLTSNSITESMEGDIEVNHTYKYNEDYFLGDVVEVVNEYGISIQPRIIEVIESEDDTGEDVVVTFSTENQKEV